MPPLPLLMPVGAIGAAGLPWLPLREVADRTPLLGRVVREGTRHSPAQRCSRRGRAAETSPQRAGEGCVPAQPPPHRTRSPCPSRRPAGADGGGEPPSAQQRDTAAAAVRELQGKLEGVMEQLLERIRHK